MDPAVSVCPYIDRGDPRCAERLTILNLRETFQYCFGQPRLCKAHRQIVLEERHCEVPLRIAQPA